MKKTPVIWFSRHQPSPEQINAIQSAGWKIVDLEHGLRLGNVNLKTDEDVYAVMNEIRAMAAKTGAVFIVGVFPVPIQQLLLIQSLLVAGSDKMHEFVTCFSSWNVSRPVEGQKPTFEHKEFCFVGNLIIREY